MTNCRKPRQRIFRKLARDTEFDDLVGAERFDQLGGRSERDHFSMVHDRDAVAETRRFFHVVGCQQDRCRHRRGIFRRCPTTRDALADRVRWSVRPETAAPDRLRAHKQLRALFLSTGEFAYARVSFFFQPDRLNNFIDAVTALIETAKEPQGLDDCHLFCQLRFL